MRIDNATSVRYGSIENVLSVRADASFGSGHWYEGGGIYRPVHLVHIASKTRIVHNGVFVSPETDGSIITASVELEQISGAKYIDADNSSDIVAVSFTLRKANSKIVVATNTTAYLTPKKSGTTIVTALLFPHSTVDRWSVHEPNLYIMRADVIRTIKGKSDIVDSQEVDVGFRTTSWKNHDNFQLNKERFKLRGFSHHNSIGGLGVAIPERIYLFRAQASRALGSNIWRMSHNPYVPALYEILDRTGIMCWDENRDYGAKYLGGAYVRAMHDMVKRDRNHPSIIIWSFCNEYECQQNDPYYSAIRYRSAAYGVDGSRPVTANAITYGMPSTSAREVLDVQGGSHADNQTLAKFHSKFPSQPLVLSECCSCMSQRISDEGTQNVERDIPVCIAQENSPGLLPDVSGSLGVWTLMDYFGEPAGVGTSGWPYVSSNYGQFDIAGFPKPHAFWYAVNWLQSFSTENPGRPPLPSAAIARVITLPPPGGVSSGTVVTTITSAPYAELYLDGKSKGIAPSPLNDLGEHAPMNWSCSENGYMKNITLIAWSAASEGKILARHTILVANENKDTYSIKLTLDVPSKSTGTGSSLVLDGRDTAMLRSAIVDDDGALVASAKNRVKWRVVSGPGQNAGVSNGNPASHEWMKSDAVDSFGGLARGLIRVSIDCTSAMRDLAALIDVDHRWPDVDDCKAEPIVVEASSPGLKPAHISIPTSTDVDQYGVLAVASKSLNEEFSYLTDFAG